MMYRCLIADDEKIIRDDLETLIDWQAEGITLVGLATNGRTAYDIFVRERPDIVITDIKMPSVDGIELSRMILETDADVVVVFLTGYKDSEYAIQAVNIGVKRYLLKYELTAASLQREVREIVRILGERRKAVARAEGVGGSEAGERRYSRKVTEAIECIQRGYRRNPRLSEVADQIGISKIYLCAAFKKETGENFVDYVNRVKIEEAKLLLRDTDSMVHEVARNVGYESLQYFSLVFKRIVGKNPSEYRKDLRP
jgi:two-component system, response regulator YesN